MYPINHERRKRSTRALIKLLVRANCKGSCPRLSGSAKLFVVAVDKTRSRKCRPDCDKTRTFSFTLVAHHREPPATSQRRVTSTRRCQQVILVLVPTRKEEKELWIVLDKGIISDDERIKKQQLKQEKFRPPRRERK